VARAILIFPRPYGEELEVLGPLKVGRRISLLVFLFRHHIEIWQTLPPSHRG